MGDPGETRDRLEAIRKRAEEATPGPWRWNVNLATRNMSLEALGRALETVLAFDRWGMRGGQARFRVDGIMEDTAVLSVPIPGREHHADWFRTIAHPDAEFIAHAQQDMDWLLGEVSRLRERVKELEAANE